MTDISQEKKDELLDLVTKQKKAKIAWVATITQIPEEDILKVAEEIGLTIEDDFILHHSETADGKAKIALTKNHNLLVEMAINERIHRKYITLGKDGQVSQKDKKFLGVFQRANPNHPLREQGETIAIALIYDLFGTVSAGKASLEVMKDIRKGLLHLMLSSSKNNIHYFVPITKYYELIEIPKNNQILKQKNLTKRVIADCKLLDNVITNLSSVLAQNSIFEIPRKLKLFGHSHYVKYGDGSAGWFYFNKDVIALVDSLERWQAGQAVKRVRYYVIFPNSYSYEQERAFLKKYHLEIQILS